MPSPTRPRGRLRRRVYWTRRVLVALLALGLVLVLGRLFGLGSSDQGPVQASTASSGTTLSATDGPVQGPVLPPGLASADATKAGAAGEPGAGKRPVRGALVAPDGDCAPSDVLATPLVRGATGGRAVAVFVRFTGTRPACTFEVTARTLAVRIEDADGRVWSSQDCTGAVPRRTVTVRSEVASAVPVRWNGRRTGAGCSLGDWALPATYRVTAAAIGSDATETTFRLGLPSPAVLTRTAKPEPRPTPTTTPTTPTTPTSPTAR